jgi:hypothetical protein
MICHGDLELDRSRMARRPEVVCSPEQLGAARPTRHSLGQSMLRRAAGRGWSVAVECWDVDRAGRGEIVYRIDAEGHTLRFVAFSQLIDESERSDRVIAERWDITAALIRGQLDPGRLATLRCEVPRQEDGKADAGTLVWTRANRSERHFARVADRLAAGHQPSRHSLGWSAYVLRSTAFYANGKFGMASYDALGDCPPIAFPYRAQMLAAWLLRELGLDLVEHIAARRSPRATTLSQRWRRSIGIGNATGLGLVPFPINHPEIFDGWCSARELALTYARAAPVERVEAGKASVRERLTRARAYFAARSEEPYAPFRPAAELVDGLASVEHQVGRVRSWDCLWGWAEEHVGLEVQEILLSCLADEVTELDEDIERALVPVGSQAAEPLFGRNVGMLIDELEDRYSWALELARDDGAARYFWYYARESEEPRRGLRGSDPGEPVAMPIDIPKQMQRLRASLTDAAPTQSAASFVLEHPEHRQALTRLLSTRELTFGEPRVNVEAADFLPLRLQRFQLAMYGAENYIPQSDTWLRVTLMQGAPSRHELAGYRHPTNPLFLDPCQAIVY